MPMALRAADTHRERVSDIVILQALHRPSMEDVRTHFISTSWSVLQTMTELSRLLGNIEIELIDVSTSGGPNAALGVGVRAEDDQT